MSFEAYWEDMVRQRESLEVDAATIVIDVKNFRRALRAAYDAGRASPADTKAAAKDFAGVGKEGKEFGGLKKILESIFEP
jgi:hypothetical protein